MGSFFAKVRRFFKTKKVKADDEYISIGFSNNTPKVGEAMRVKLGMVDKNEMLFFNNARTTTVCNVKKVDDLAYEIRTERGALFLIANEIQVKVQTQPPILYNKSYKILYKNSNIYL